MPNNKNIIPKDNAEVILKRSQSLLDITKDILKSSKKEVSVKPNQELVAADDTFVLIKAGSFMMGSDENKDEQPIHKVTIDYDFYMSKYQLTFEEYDLFCEATGKEKPYDEGWGWGRGKRPVIKVSWEDATEYCEWRSAKEGKTYRLPTEAEWEYACRAGTTTKWSFGDDELELAQYAWFDKNSFNKGFDHKDYGTHPVGDKKPNPWGLYDMHGNVWEWCEDWYFANYNKAPTDGSANEYGHQEYKVLRGGSCDDGDHYTRSSYRLRSTTDYRSYNVGFRLVLQGTLP